MACRTFGKLETRSLKPNRFKNQSSDTLKLVAHNCNHHQVFIKQKKCCSLLLWFQVKVPLNIVIAGKHYR